MSTAVYLVSWTWSSHTGKGLNWISCLGWKACRKFIVSYVVLLNSVLESHIEEKVIDITWWLEVGFEDVHGGLLGFMEVGALRREKSDSVFMFLMYIWLRTESALMLFSWMAHWMQRYRTGWCGWLVVDRGQVCMIQACM